MSAMAPSLTPRGKRRIFLGHACQATLSETRETGFFDLKTPAEKVLMALQLLLVQVELSDLGLVLDVTAGTILLWLDRAAHQAHAMNAQLLRDLPVTQV